MDRKLDWDALRIFLVASRAGSLRRASEQLGVNHATIRRAIQGLEDALGTRVFERSSSGLALTQPGETLITHAEEMESQTAQISRKLLGLDTRPTGRVRVSIPPSLTTTFLAPILAGFTKAHPDISIDVIATNKFTNLRKFEADVSVRVAYEVDDDVVGRRVLRYVTGAFAAPEYLSRHPDLRVGDGRGAHWIGWGGSSKWVSDSPFPSAKVRHNLPEIYNQIEAASHGIGMILIPCFLGDACQELVRIPEVKPYPDRSIWLLLHGDLQKSARVRAFIDYTSQAIRSNRDAYET